MSYDNAITRPGAQPAMREDVYRPKPKPSKGLAGPAKTKGKPAAHKPTKHR